MIAFTAPDMNKIEGFQKYMQICDKLAAKAAEKGNAPVGSIILNGSQIIAEAEEAGSSKQDITCHAEIEALRKARKKMGADLSGCTLVSTHEPCVMCGYAIRFHKISKVVYKNSVPHFGSVSSSMDVLLTEDTPKHWSQPPQVIQLD
ncbi:MAG: tRNA(adenine34) deaminase [Saprospiraceae bacterium]|jgi:tRNA(adenine34) deaminase